MEVSKDVENIITKIRLIVFDFDGVFTNNRVIVNELGDEAVVCNRSDGIGLSRLTSIGVDMFILSTETNNVVNKRAYKLNIESINGCENKFKRLQYEIDNRKLDLSEVAYMGNDINDKECLEKVGLPIIVADAHESVSNLGRIITKARGGEGAVREICDLIYAIKTRK